MDNPELNASSEPTLNEAKPISQPDPSTEIDGDAAPIIPDAEVVVSETDVATAPRAEKLHASSVLSQVQFAMLALTIALFIITFIVQAFRIPSGSMEDTLLVGDYLLVDKTRFGPSGFWHSILPYRDIHRGDIIVFRYPIDPTQHFVKRVIGLPGDHIRLWHSRVFVNGHALQENYVVFKEHFPDDFRDNFPRGSWFNENVRVEWATGLRTLVKEGELTVPPDKYFVLGDNRDQSLDSRYWGFVPRENIIGRPMVIYFSMVEASDDDGPVAGRAADDKLLTLPARISHVFDDLRWRRILRLAP